MGSIINHTVQDLLSAKDKLSGPSVLAAEIWFGFLGFLLVTYYVLPGKRVKAILKGDNYLYPANGFYSFLLLIVFFYLGVFLNWWRATVIYDNFWSLFTLINIFCIVQTVFLYIKGTYLISASERAKNHTTGSVFSDLWYGTELNPRLLGLDFKYFGYRPLIIGWAMLILSMAHEQYARHGTISASMFLYFCFTWYYTIDYLWVEEKICSTWDVLAENFGFGLTWGDHLFYPFFYSIQAHYLIDSINHEPGQYKSLDLNVFQITGILAVYITGYTIFRQSNSQKDAFKREGKKAIIAGKPATTTKDGRLLTAGWWGVARHINYLGDILMAIGWTLPTGFSSLIPWTHSMFFIPFLIHREMRDEAKMKDKYKGTYVEYCKIAKWRILPYVY